MKSKPILFAVLFSAFTASLAHASGSSRVKPQQTPREEVRDIHVAEDGSPNNGRATAGVEANPSSRGKVQLQAPSPSSKSGESGATH